jgi:5,10-methylenetetrahydromethanopterin reductase
MRISCIFGPTTETPAHIELAESLGYHCAYCYDSPALGADVYVTLALAAERTRTIRLGTGMMIPRLRHVMTTAAAYATLHRLAPGRVVMGVGFGFTGSRLLGQRAMRWQDIKDYVLAVRALLRGEELEWEGALISLVPSPDFEKSLPLDLLTIVAADGPKGHQVARDLGAGLCMGVPVPQEDFDWLAAPLFGTVLEPGELPESDRVWDAVGAGVALVYHLVYEFSGAQGVDELPGGKEWRERIETIPAERRHLELHRGHGHRANDIDCQFLPRSMTCELAAVGDADTIRQSVADLAQLGLTELLFNPLGPGIPRELECFAEATTFVRDDAFQTTTPHSPVRP